MSEFIYSISWDEGEDRKEITVTLIEQDLTKREVQLISAILHGKRGQIESGHITTKPIFKEKKK